MQLIPSTEKAARSLPTGPVFPRVCRATRLAVTLTLSSSLGVSLLLSVVTPPGSRAFGSETRLAGSASFQPLGDLPGGEFESLAYAISRDGSTVVGASQSAGSGFGREAFRWTEAAGMSGLGGLGPGDIASLARDVSFDGSVIVGSSNGQPFRWTESVGMTSLLSVDDGFLSGQAFGVSGDGSVVAGVAASIEGNQAVRWTQATGTVGLGWLPGPIRDSFLFGVSEDGTLGCGISMTGSDAAVRVVRWSEAEGLVDLGDVPGGIDYAIGWGMTADGLTIVGGARTAFGSNDEPFIWSDGVYSLPDLTHGAGGSHGFEAVSDNGEVAVGSGAAGALLWTNAGGLRSLQDVLSTDHGVDLAGWNLISALDVSADGRSVVGYGTNPAGALEAWIARLPVPSSTPDEAPGASNGLAVAASLRITGSNPSKAGVDLIFEPAVSAHGNQPRAGTSLRVRVLDASGRVLRRWNQPVSDRSLSVHWDARNEHGRRVPAGRYWVKANQTGHPAASVTVAITR